jgi:hypothetical protein
MENIRHYLFDFRNNDVLFYLYSHNPLLFEYISELLARPLLPTNKLGVNSDAKQQSSLPSLQTNVSLVMNVPF